MTGPVVSPPSPIEGNIRTVGFPLSSSVNRADPNHIGGGTIHGRRGRVWGLLISSTGERELWGGLHGRGLGINGGVQRTAELPEVDDDARTTGLLTDRIFRYTPLHDYESACWIAVWFVFWCRPEGTTDEEMRRARNPVYKNHCTTFGADAIRTACWLLPGILRPLGITLVEMRDTLAVAYLVFETSFDGSKILPVYRGVRRYLFYLF